MGGFWRVYNTLQPDLAPLPDRTPPPQAVDSTGLLGKTYNGVTLTQDNLDAWIRPQLPPQGLRRSDQDASVWNWTIDKSTPSAPVYLGEPDDTSSWPNFPNVVPGHPPAYLGDQYAQTAGLTNRPKILFDPDNGRIAWPLLRTHVGQRPPFSPNAHSGAPYLGETGGQAPDPSKAVDPWANRPDGICPQGAPLRHYNVVAIELPIQVTRKGATDPTGMIYVLAHNKADVLAGRKPAEPLAIRANVGDCVAVTLTSELKDADAFRQLLQGQHAHPSRAVRHAGLRRRDHGYVLRAVDPAVQGGGSAADGPGRRGRHHAAALQRGQVPQSQRRAAEPRWLAASGVDRHRAGHRGHRGAPDQDGRRHGQHGDADPAAQRGARRRGVGGDRVHAVPLVPRCGPGQRLLPRPRGRHPHLGPRAARTAHRGAGRRDLHQP